MKMRRCVAVLANGAAILLLGLVGVAMAGPVVTFSDGLALYGPSLFSGTFNVISSFDSPDIFSGYVSGSLLYATPDVSQLLSLVTTDAGSLLSFLSSHSSGPLVVLSADNSLFANVPEPMGLAVVVSGVAALSFVRRRFRRRQPE